MFLTQTYTTANFISIVIILVLIPNLIESVFFFFDSYTFYNPRLRKLFNPTLRKGFNRCMLIYNFIKSFRKL